MKPQMAKGLGLAKNGLRAVKGGQMAFRWGRRLRQLPPLRKRAEARAAAKALKKEGKQNSGQKTRRRFGRKGFCRDARTVCRVLSAVRKRYF